jgi:hypothetical protein
VREFKPRDYQGAIMRFIAEHERCNVWSGMGTGKSVSTLTILQGLALVEDPFPALVLAPLRVAQSTWPDEAQKWAHLNGLNIGAACGDAPFRRGVLRRRPDIVTTNYDNLPWLAEEVKDSWPFRTVVADEATRLKSFRVLQGGIRARALGRVAHKHVRRWVNLTGSPAPNGLLDLWGQQWFIDAGVRLGRSFGAYQNRWFKTQRAPGQAFGGVTTPLPGAEDEIYRLLADCTITVRAADYLDLPPLIENVIEVNMPAKAKALYKELEREMFLKLDTGAEVEAFNAASLTMKCIAEGTEVLTQRGWAAIETVSRADRVWDGVEWVETDGAAFNGYKTVIECCGVLMTPDHKVLTVAGWREAQEINNADASKRLVRADVRLPDGHTPRRAVESSQIQTSNVEAPVHLRNGSSTDGGKSSIQNPRRAEVVWVPSGRNASSGLGLPRHDRPSCLGDLERHEIALREPKRQGLAKLRFAWRQGLRTMARVVLELLGRYGPDVGARADAGSEKQQRGLQQKQLPVGNSRGPSQQPSGERLDRNATGAHDGSPGVQGFWREVHHAAQAAKAGLAGCCCARTARVFDLVNAGPRHRFVVRGSAGNLLVHNCLQLANGALYTDADGTFEEIHDAKIQALHSVVGEAAGAPVLVAYHFKSDLARLQRAFPQGRALDTGPGTIQAWNAGQIPVLFAHPASAGHGLNLQDGGNIIVFFGLWWDLEQHEQIIERIGPTRQAQSGYNRPVFVHRLITKGTVDKLVLARLQTKASVQSLLLDAMKGQR